MEVLKSIEFVFENCEVAKLNIPLEDGPLDYIEYSDEVKYIGRYANCVHQNSYYKNIFMLFNQKLFSLEFLNLDAMVSGFEETDEITEKFNGFKQHLYEYKDITSIYLTFGNNDIYEDNQDIVERNRVEKIGVIWSDESEYTNKYMSFVEKNINDEIYYELEIKEK